MLASHPISELKVVRKWLQICNSRQMMTTAGERISIIFPGRQTGDRGPDFSGAIIQTPRGRIRGDIEIHVRSSDWERHNHHLDPAYNRVALHVCWVDPGVETRCLDDRSVPKVVIGEIPTAASETNADLAKNTLNNDDLPDLLDQAGTERFQGKIACFRRELAEANSGQVLYRGIMGALGYAKNQIPFRELTARVPLHLLEVGGKSLDREAYSENIKALLLGAAGFSPLPQLPAAPSARTSIRPISPKDWDLLQVRPHNSPVLRITAFSHLLARYRNNGILYAMLALVGSAPENGEIRYIETGLQVSDGHRCLLGPDRAADIVTNIILPFCGAWGQSNDQTELAEKAARLYNAYPRISANAIEKHMSRQLRLTRETINSAKRQQGLIHLYRNRCIQGACTACQLCSRSPAITSRSRPSRIPALSR